MPTSPRYRILIWSLAAITGLVVLAALAVAAAAATMPFCGSCHRQPAFTKATEAAPHASVRCSSCHGGSTLNSRLEFGFDEVFGMALRVKSVDRTVAAVSRERCSKCHGKLTKTSESAGLRISHVTCAKGRTCTDCHSPTAHGSAQSWPKSATMEMCLGCHGPGGAFTDCDRCHAGRLPRERIQTGVFAVTHGPNHKKTHGMGEMSSCGACHKPSKCASCHGPGVPHTVDYVNNHGKPATSKFAKCNGCHLKDFCTDCHQTQMPHPSNFGLKHAKVVGTQGDASCMRCHVREDCTQCHEDHVHPVTLEQLNQFKHESGEK